MLQQTFDAYNPEDMKSAVDCEKEEAFSTPIYENDDLINFLNSKEYNYIRIVFDNTPRFKYFIENILNYIKNGIWYVKFFIKCIISKELNYDKKTIIHIKLPDGKTTQDISRELNEYATTLKN